MAGFLANIAAALERKSAGTRFGAADDLWQKLYDNRSRAGVSVTAMTALRVTTVLACAIRIAEGTSTVPCKLFQKRPGDKDARHASGLSVNDVISRVPNGQQNSLELREQLTIHARIAGAAYCWINRVRGEIAELVPFEPEARIKLDRSNPDEWVYTFRLNDGSTVQLPQREVWHFRGPGWKTAEGFEATKVCRDAIGLAIATEESQSLLHANGAHPGGLLSIDGRLGDPGKQQLRDMARERMEGLQNAYRTLVLDQGARWTPFQMTGVDNQHLETRRFQVEEICRGLGVLPIMVGHYDKAATFASAEQMFLHHVVHTIRPWHRRFEYSMNHQLLTPDQRHEGFYFRFVDTELLRGDHKTRGEYYQKAIEAGWMVPEEPRGFEDMPWVAGLDRPRMPLNQAIVDENGVVVPNDPKSESR